VPEPGRADKSVVTSGKDLWELVVAYAKQETVDPLRNLGRWLGLGAAGSLLIGLGAVLLLLAVLRVLQTETGTTFTGSWSWAPYLITLVGAVSVILVSVLAINRSKEKSR
jgi:hypothetical protein